MTGLRSYNDSTSKRVLDLLKTRDGILRLREFTVGKITVVNCGVNDRGSSGTDS